MAESEEFHTCPSAQRFKQSPPESEIAKQSASEERMSHPRLRSYESMARTSVDKFLKQCPNAASLTPSPNSLPMTPRTMLEMDFYLKKARFRQRRLIPTSDEWWRWESRKQNVKARMLDMQYRRILAQGADGWNESDWERRGKNLRLIMLTYVLNREKWMDCVGCISGCNWDSWEMRKEESKRARRFGGLVHVVLLEEKLQNVVKEINLEGGQYWNWKEMTTERKSKYFGIEDKYIEEEAEEEDNVMEYLDAAEEPHTDGTNSGQADGNSVKWDVLRT